jgi:hypothetical protein
MFTPKSLLQGRVLVDEDVTPTAARLLRPKLLLVVGLTVGACSPTRGCIESDFVLSPDSRIPAWFRVSPTARREDYEVTVDYWSGPFGRTATVSVKTRRGWPLDSVVAEQRGNQPLTLVPHSATGRIPYPTYEVLTARGITEVIEHRRMEPVCYLVDDPEIRNKLGVK